jgi:hypothetical protein
MRPSLPAPCSFWGSTRATRNGQASLPIRRALPFNGHSPRSRTRRACESGIDYAKAHQPQAKSAVRRVYEYG